jgi:hypothetical protein
VSEERIVEETISQEDLNKQTESSVEISSTEKVGSSVNKELYKTEEKKAEQAIEKSGEKLKVQTSSSSDDDTDEQAVDIRDVEKSIDEMKKLDVGEQVEHLVQVAIHKDPVLAIGIAKHLNDNYILDELHSDLTEDKVRDILDKKGLL